MPDRPIAVFVVWERVISSDWSPPISAVLARIPDSRVSQFWDPDRVLSHHLGETADRETIVWDWVAVYPEDAKWGSSPPTPDYSGRPVVRVASEFEQALRKLSTARNAGPR